MARNKIQKPRGTLNTEYLCELCGNELKCKNCDSNDLSRHIRKQSEIYYTCKKCDASFFCRCQSVKGLFI